VIVCVDSPGNETAVFGEVTRKGPVPLASSSVVSAELVPPRPSRAVRRKWSDNGLALTPSTPT
jgi:hypothetical protein